MRPLIIVDALKRFIAWVLRWQLFEDRIILGNPTQGTHHDRVAVASILWWSIAHFREHIRSPRLFFRFRREHAVLDGIRVLFSRIREVQIILGRFRASLGEQAL